MDWISRDLRTGLRLLLRDKAFTLTATATLALCLGANTALFSVVHHVLLRPLPVPEPDRLVLMSNVYPRAGAGDSTNSGVPDYYDRLQATTVFGEQALYNTSNPSLDHDGTPTQIWVMNATPSYFRLMGVPAAQGRFFTDDEGEVGRERKVVLSDTLWRTRFGSDPGILGRDLRLDGQPYTVVGVMPRSFDDLQPGITLWRPLAPTPEQKSDEQRHSNSYTNVARLKPGARIERARAEIEALNAANLERFPALKEALINAGFRTVVEPFADRIVRDIKPTLYLLWGGALFVLLIGCVNVANLVLVRTRVRLKELATRLALGARPGQVARQLVVENLGLTLAAALLGLVVAGAALRAIEGFNLRDLPHAAQISLDGTAVAYALGVSLLVGLLMGLLPVFAVLPRNLASVLHEEGRSNSGARGATFLRRGLVVTQTAFTFVLLAGAGLLFASFQKVLEVDPGFVGDHVLTASVSLPRSRYSEESEQRRFTEEALRRVREQPGVRSAGASDTIPLGHSHSDSVILAEGYEMKPGESLISPNSVVVTPGYFETMGVKLVRGRFLEDRDTADSLPVILVDEKLAGRFWPGRDPIGRRLYSPGDTAGDIFAITDKTVFFTVVGVVRDVTMKDLTEGGRAVGSYFYAANQNPSRFLTFAVKASAAPEAMEKALRAAIAAVDPDLPVFDVQSMEQRKERSLLGRRSPALLSVAFGGVALLLSAVGLYGVLAYLVTQRTREIGIRMALGSSARGIFDLVLREGLLLLGAGLVVGAAGAFALRRSLESQLFGIGSGDPRVLGAVTLLLAVVAFGACALPARRATRIDPRTALTE